MTIFEQLVLILGLSADGFAAAVCMGAAEAGGRRISLAALFVTAAHGVMLAAGWLLGSVGRRFTGEAAVMLGAIVLLTVGTETILSSGKEEGCGSLPWQRMLVMSAAASVDALTVGAVFSLSGVGLLLPLGMTAAVMGLLSVSGVVLGSRIGKRWQRRARKAGGLVLCLVGLRMLLSCF